MKKQISILFLLVALFITSCSQEQVENPPFVAIPYGAITNNAGKVVNISAWNVMDTIIVGDTINIQAQFSGFYNNLKEIRITASDSSSVKFNWGEEANLDSFFTSSSDYEKGIFVTPGTYINLFFYFQYIPLKENPKLTLSFEIFSDAGEEKSYGKAEVKTPIIAPKQN